MIKFIYSLSRIGNRFRKNLPVYSVLIVLIAVGVGTIVYSWNIYFFNTEQFRHLSRNMSKSAFDIEYTPLTTVPNFYAITHDDYIRIEKEYSGRMEFQYGISTPLSYIYREGSDDFQKLELFLVFMNKEKYNRFFGKEMEKGYSYISEKAYKSLKSLKSFNLQDRGKGNVGEYSYIPLQDYALDVQEDAISFSDKNFKLKTFPDYGDVTLFKNNVGYLDGILVDSAIIIAVDEFPDFKDNIPKEEHIFSHLSVKNNFNDTGGLWKVLDYLTLAHKEEFSYRLDQKYLQLKQQLDSYLLQVKKYLLLSMFELLLVSVGTAGILYLVFFKRKKDIAISMMVGSTRKRQVMEFVGEISLLVLGGFVLGILSYFLYMGINRYDILMYNKTKVITIGLFIIITVISSSLSVIGLFKLYPIKILQEE